MNDLKMQNSSKTHPSSVLSHCPRCGSYGFKFDNNKKFICTACNFNFYINAAAAVAGIIEAPDGRIVLANRKFEPRSGFYDLPGGFVNTMERAEDALKREIYEELGISINTAKFLASFPNEYIFKEISYFTCDMAFICPVNDLSNLKPADDVADVILMRPEDINFDTICFPSIVNILKFYVMNKA